METFACYWPFVRCFVSTAGDKLHLDLCVYRFKKTKQARGHEPIHLN